MQEKGRSLCPCHRCHQKPAAYLEWLQTAEQVHETLYQMRQSAGIQFKDEKNERTISTKLERPVRNTRFDTFTEIQEQIFSPIYEGENVLGISPTGTGKTLAYLFPSLLKLKPKKAQQLLILAPNTELAGQIFDVTKQWAEPLGLQTQLFLSGSSQNGKSNVSKRT